MRRMVDMEQYALMAIAGIGLLTIFCQWISWWIKLPPILLLLITGIMVGPVMHWLDPDVLLGALLSPIISLSVAIILFEGSLTLNFRKIRGQAHVIRNMLTVGLLCTLVLTTLAIHYILNLSWGMSLILSAICSVTGPTVVTPLLRTIRPNKHLANILQWEGIAIDPIGAILAAISFSLLLAYQEHASASFFVSNVLETIGLGVLLGVSVGYALGQAMERLWMPEFLHNVVTLCTVIVVYTISDYIKDSTGLLAVTLMGVWLANKHEEIVEHLLDFKESISILLISALFIFLAASMAFDHMSEVLYPTLIVLAVMQFVIRPVSVLISTVKSDLSWNERMFLGWIYPRGIVAAAIAAFFSLQLFHDGFIGAEKLTTITFIVIIGSVLFQSITANIVASRLNVRDPEPDGLLIIGASLLAREIGLVLQKQGLQVMLCSTYWEDIRDARLKGLQTYYGHPISAHADRHIDLVGLGKMLGLSQRDHFNSLAGIRYQKEFGRQAIYSLVTHAIDDKFKDKYKASQRHLGKVLFSQESTFDKLNDDFKQGRRIQRVQLDDEVSYEDYIEAHPQALPMFAFTPKGRLEIFSADEKPSVASGWAVLFLV